MPYTPLISEAPDHHHRERIVTAVFSLNANDLTLRRRQTLETQHEGVGPVPAPLFTALSNTITRESLIRLVCAVD